MSLPTPRERARGIAERLDMWCRARGIPLPDQALGELARLTELTIEAALVVRDIAEQQDAEAEAAPPRERRGHPRRERQT